MTTTPCLLDDIARSKYLRTSLVAGAFAASISTSRATITLTTVVVTADRIYDDYSVTITSRWDGDSWEIDFDIYFGTGGGDGGGPIALDGEMVHFVGEMFKPDGDGENPPQPRLVWESMPFRIADVFGVTREYSLGYVYTLYIGGDGNYYYLAVEDVNGLPNFYWKVENSDGTWSVSPSGPPSVFPTP